MAISATNRSADTPDFSWAASLLFAHLLCYAGMIAAAVAGGAMLVYLIILLPIYLAFLGGGLGVICRKLRDWHMDCLPVDAVPDGPTPAEREVTRLKIGLQWAILMVGAAGLGFMVAMQEGVVMMMLPLMISLCASWFALTIALPHKRMSRAETEKREALWQQRPYVHRARVRQHNKIETLKRTALFAVPFGVAYLILRTALPDSYVIDLSGKIAMLIVLIIAVWPNSHLQEDGSPPKGRLAKKFRMPRQKF